MEGLVGKTALVTGASSGIGQVIVVRFAREGASAAINYLVNAAWAIGEAERGEADAEG